MQEQNNTFGHKPITRTDTKQRIKPLKKSDLSLKEKATIYWKQQTTDNLLAAYQLAGGKGVRKKKTMIGFLANRTVNKYIKEHEYSN